MLARLNHEGVAVPPDQFIPIAEEYGPIPEISKVITEGAFSVYSDMKQLGSEPGSIAINFAAQQFREPDIVEQVQDWMFQYGLSASDLTIEITETALIGRATEVVANRLQQFRDMGAKVALDDFGTGFLSLSHPRDFTVDKIKTDKRFVGSVVENEEDRALIKGLVERSRCLNLEVVAEGVETKAQAGCIADIGGQFIQGYYHVRPLSPENAAAFLTAQQRIGVSLHNRSAG